MKTTYQSASTKNSSRLRNVILACVVSSISVPLISIAQMNSSEPKSAPNGSKHSNAMAEGKNMAIKKSMDGMQQKMSSMNMTGNIDHDFAMMMKEHHQGAIDMAEIELKQGKDPQLKKMSTKIIAAQKKEMAEFDAWLKKHEASMGTAQPSK